MSERMSEYIRMYAPVGITRSTVIRIVGIQLSAKWYAALSQYLPMKSVSGSWNCWYPTIIGFAWPGPTCFLAHSHSWPGCEWNPRYLKNNDPDKGLEEWKMTSSKRWPAIRYVHIHIYIYIYSKKIYMHVYTYPWQLNATSRLPTRTYGLLLSRLTLKEVSGDQSSKPPTSIYIYIYI